MCAHVPVCLCVCAAPDTAFNGYMLLNMVETVTPLDTLHLMHGQAGSRGLVYLGICHCSSVCSVHFLSSTNGLLFFEFDL